MTSPVSVPSYSLLCFVAIAIAGITPTALAQSEPRDPFNLNNPIFLREPEFFLPAPTTPFKIDLPEDSALEVSCPVPTGFSYGGQVKQIRVEGNTVLEEEIASVLEQFENQYINFATLSCLTRKVIQPLYWEDGYRGVTVRVPEQESDDGIIKINVTEGRIDDIHIDGLQHLRKEFVRSRLQRVSTPLHLPSLNAALQALQQQPFIEKIEAELNRSDRDESSYRLSVMVTEAPQFRPRASFDNYHSPSTGGIEAQFLAEYDNLGGGGDRLSAGYGLSEGFQSYSLGYSIPVNPFDGRLSLRYSRSDTHIITEDFRDFGIRGEEERFSIGFRQPLYQTQRSELAFGLTFDLRRSQTFLFDDIPFSFTRGAERGEFKVSALRFSQEWRDVSPDRLFVARSQFSVGLDAFGATVNNTGTDGRFFSWQGEFAWRQQFSPNLYAIARLRTQLTPDSLPAIERLSLGGASSLTGYRPSQLSADNGIFASLEARISLISNSEPADAETAKPKTANFEHLQLIPSLAIATVWNNDTPNPNPSTLASLGLGLRWQIIENLFVRLDYGIPLVDLENRGSSLQDRGLFFALRYEF
ncbi:MAG: ShlB/FhaC/HecB family hemolysin secretion/activation protein [Spirulina sp.]